MYEFYQTSYASDINFIEMPAVIIVMFVIVALTAAWFRLRFEDSFGSDSKNHLASYILPQRLDHSYEHLLETTFLFYRNLDHRNKRKFGSRVMKFIIDKEFVGRDELEVTKEMQVLIAASAIRVTWGLNTYLFPTFHSILIYPGKFYSGLSKAVVKGETNMGGIIVFSWKDFLFGISDMNDNLNLGYHEFGHALFVERFKSSLGNRFNRNYDAWRRLVFSGGKLKEAELKHTFRDYATYNEHEFFAVAVENFFERPEKFRKDLPKLYQQMAKMLNQNPLAPVRHYDRMFS